MGFFYFYTFNSYEMNIKQYLDSTYLKTAAQANLSEDENTEVVKNCIQEAIDNDFKLNAFNMLFSFNKKMLKLIFALF